jgi:hypothetical protein
MLSFSSSNQKFYNNLSDKSNLNGNKNMQNNCTTVNQSLIEAPLKLPSYNKIATGENSVVMDVNDEPCESQEEQSHSNGMNNDNSKIF